MAESLPQDLLNKAHSIIAEQKVQKLELEALSEHPKAERRPNWVECRTCGQSWVGFYLPLPISDAAKIMKNLTCPNCASGSDKIVIFDGSVRL